MLQCGADSLVGDRLGIFNLSTYGHGSCVAYVKSFNIPMLVVVVGGYTKTSVARCWTYETSILVGEEISNDLPETDYYNFFRPTYKLHLVPDRMKNMNTPEYLENIKMHVIGNIRHLPGSPSVQMNELPPKETVFTAMKRRQNRSLPISHGLMSRFKQEEETGFENDY